MQILIDSASSLDNICLEKFLMALNIHQLSYQWHMDIALIHLMYFFSISAFMCIFFPLNFQTGSCWELKVHTAVDHVFDRPDAWRPKHNILTSLAFVNILTRSSCIKREHSDSNTLMLTFLEESVQKGIILTHHHHFWLHSRQFCSLWVNFLHANISIRKKSIQSNSQVQLWNAHWLTSKCHCRIRVNQVLLNMFCSGSLLFIID